MEDAQAHLDSCTDSAAISAYKAEQARLAARNTKKKEKEGSEEETMAFKTWEINGRQVGQLWMLSERILTRECKKLSLDSGGSKVELITRLGRVLRERERKMLTMETKDSKSNISYDITPINKVDAEDLPSNLEALE